MVGAEAKKKPPMSHKDSLVAVVGCVVGAENHDTDTQLCIRAQGQQDPGYPIWPLLAMALSQDPTSPGVKRTSSINRTCNFPGKLSLCSMFRYANHDKNLK